MFVKFSTLNFALKSCVRRKSEFLSSATWSLCDLHFSQLANWNFHRPFVHARILYILVVILLKFHPLLNNFSFFVKRLFFSSFYLEFLISLSFFLFCFFNFWVRGLSPSLQARELGRNERSCDRHEKHKKNKTYFSYFTLVFLFSFFFLFFFLVQPSSPLLELGVRDPGTR